MALAFAIKDSVVRALPNFSNTPVAVLVVSAASCTALLKTSVSFILPERYEFNILNAAAAIPI